MSHRVPDHLKKFCVEQDYSRYTPEDQAVWRYVMRQLKNFLSKHAHPCYVEGLKKTGIEVDTIPHIATMDKKLNEFGWGAVAVSGFIPPAAFMEFQSLGILPIACDMRTLDHILYTPAPDIVHEAAGHAPILVDPQFSEYLSQYAQVAANAIISDEDLKMYEAIRDLSDIKEDPSSTDKDIQAAEDHLTKTVQQMSFVSEAALLGRMNWWTAEYGLIGPVGDPKLFGAGLLSSVGESQECLSSKVKKIPLSVDCVKFSYDITEPQPQLFVTPDFPTLTRVLNELAKTMSYQIGGKTGLDRAVQAKTVNTVELDSGLQISGVVKNYVSDKNEIVFVKLVGPSQLSLSRKEIPGHDKFFHKDGYSTPVGELQTKIIWEDLRPTHNVELEWKSGFRLKGQFKSFTKFKDKPVLVTFENCRVWRGSEDYFKPEWGTFDLALGAKVVSVFGGPADRKTYALESEFVAKRVPPKKFSEQKLREFDFYQVLRLVREKKPASSEVEKIVNHYFDQFSAQWLMGVELLELADAYHLGPLSQKLATHLRGLAGKNKSLAGRIEDGIHLAGHPL